MKSYFGYVRVSTIRQGEKGSSLQEQRGSIEAYAQKQGLQIAGWFEEMETAATQGRRLFNRMLQELERGRADGVIIHKIDRSARNLKDWAHLGELIDRGIDVHFAHESLDLHSRGGRLSADIQAVVAADYIRNLRDEVKKGIYGRLKQGIYPLPAPIGYLDQGSGKAKIPDPATAALIQRAFERYATGQFTLGTLRDALREEGLRGRSGKPLSRSALARFLRNPFYIGLIRIQKTRQTFEGVHTPLVDKALFERVQAVLSGRAVPRAQKHAFLFRRRVRCAACTRFLVAEKQKGRVYYRCHASPCPGLTWREDTLLAAFRDFLSLVAFTEEEMGDLRDLARDEQAADVQRTALARAKIASELQDHDERMKRLTDALVDGLIGKEDFERRKGELLLERLGCTERMARAEEVSSADALIEKLELGNTALLSHEDGNFREMMETVRQLSSNLEVEAGKLVITPSFPFDVIAQTRLLSASGPCRVDVRTTDETGKQIREVPEYLSRVLHKSELASA